jgi:hypothetical protein
MGGTALTGAESAIERAIAAQTKQQAAHATPLTPRPAMAAQPAGGLRPAAPGSFGQRAAR